MLTSGEILSFVSIRYSTCESYEDSGEVTTHFVDAHGDRESKRTFTTCFVRPREFHFEFAVTPSRSNERVRQGVVSQTNEGGLRFFSACDFRMEHPTSVEAALEHFAAGSERASMIVPSMLGVLPCTPLGWPNDCGPLTTEVCDGRECFVIEGRGRGRTRRMWIECETLLVVREVTRMTYDGLWRNAMASDGKVPSALIASLPDFTTTSTITWKPRMNAKVVLPEFEAEDMATVESSRAWHVVGEAPPPLRARYGE